MFSPIFKDDLGLQDEFGVGWGARRKLVQCDQQMFQEKDASLVLRIPRPVAPPSVHVGHHAVRIHWIPANLS